MKQYRYKECIRDDQWTWMTGAPESYLFFDIETTGLSAARSDLYMIGCGYAEGDHMTETLLFNDDGCSEPEMLAAFRTLSDKFETIVTYNGDTFDLPYIREKYRQFRQPSFSDGKTSLDVYKKLRPYKKLLQMESMKQSALEARMGCSRNTFLSGKDLIDVYRRYLRTKDAALLEQLLTHNKDDIAGLCFVSRALLLPAFFEGAFEISSVEEKERELLFRLHMKELPVETNLACGEMKLRTSGCEALLTLPVYGGELKYFYPDYKNYYFLPKEHKALHKDVARYVDPAFRVKAGPDMAYTPKNGRFVPTLGMHAPYLYRKDYKDKNRYMEWNRELLQDREFAKEYVRRALLRMQKMETGESG